MNVKNDIAWREDGTPYSFLFDDVYFSSGSGPEEVKHVFIEPNQIEDRIQTDELSNIGELGFGTGLNFLMTWALYKTMNVNQTLNFYSVEKYPMNREQFQQAFISWPELKVFSDQLLNKVDFEQGWNRIDFEGMKLHLFIGDVQEFLNDLITEHSQMDVWFLDGFSPSKNPEMWNASTLLNVGIASKCKATFSTYTVVGQVRRDLIKAGFEVSKITGFGKKREMLFGIKQ